MALTTPFGDVILEYNGVKCEYSYEQLPNTIVGADGLSVFDVDSRYKIIPLISESLSFPFTLRCYIETNIVFNDMSECETGEYYSAASMLFENIKLCIGSYDEIDEVLACGRQQIIGGGLVLWEYAINGIEIHVGAKQYLKYAFFCIAWKTLGSGDHTTNGETDVWLAAEPFLCN